MLTSRLIPCLDIRGGRIVKGVRFQNLRDAGDPVAQARRYEQAGADELVVLESSKIDAVNRECLSQHSIPADRSADLLPAQNGGASGSTNGAGAGGKAARKQKQRR